MTLRGLLLACSLVIAARMAHAEVPWATGVSEQQKATAETELQLGNERFVEADYAGALGHYRSAIASWDHPAIRFNVVRCLIQLDRPIEASDNLQQALRYGAAPLEDAVYREALSYQKLLANQVGDLAIACDQAGVSLSLDGKRLATCPYSANQRLTSGPHQLVGEHQGFLTTKIDINVVGGKTVTQRVALAPIAAAARVEHRFAQWLPWTVFGGGLLVAGVGGLLELSASGQFDSYDQTIAGQCADIGGCPASTAIEERHRAERMDRIAIGVIGVGAAATIVGSVLLVMNRGTTVYGEHAVKTAVTVTNGGAFASVVGTF